LSKVTNTQKKVVKEKKDKQQKSQEEKEGEETTPYLKA
jgi:hypothetical protein